MYHIIYIILSHIRIQKKIMTPCYKFSTIISQYRTCITTSTMQQSCFIDCNIYICNFNCTTCAIVMSKQYVQCILF